MEMSARVVRHRLDPRPRRDPPALEAEGPATIAIRAPPGLEIGYGDER